MTLNVLATDLTFIMAMGPSQSQPGQEQPIWASMIPMVLMIGVFYFILIRPQLKAKKEQDKMVAGLKSGDEVVTSGGIMGTVSHVKEGSVMLKISEGVKIEVVKSHVTALTSSEKKN